MIDIFTKHPRQVGETYGQHFVSAMSFGALMGLGALFCLVHALVPALFKRTASGIIVRLHERMVLSRHRGPVQP